MFSKVRVFVCELESKGRKYEVEVAAVLEVSRTKKGRSKEAVSEDMLSDGLSDCRLSRPGEPVQPEDRGLVEIFSPRLDLGQDSLARAPEAASAISMLITGATSTAAAIQRR